MEHKYETNIKCPYCDWEDQDSWEFYEDYGVHSCGNCDKEFNVTREVEVTYSTSRIKCEEDEHDYQFKNNFLKKQEFKGGIWITLPENQWTYYKIEECTKCDDQIYVKIPKE